MEDIKVIDMRTLVLGSDLEKTLVGVEEGKVTFTHVIEALDMWIDYFAIPLLVSSFNNGPTQLQQKYPTFWKIVCDFVAYTPARVPDAYSKSSELMYQIKDLITKTSDTGALLIYRKCRKLAEINLCIQIGSTMLATVMSGHHLSYEDITGGSVEASVLWDEVRSVVDPFNNMTETQTARELLRMNRKADKEHGE